jgi:predicted AlkP superfamily phosphohydrolase/phosphomutase
VSQAVRVLFLGWDGAEPALIEPWVAQGRLPVLRDLIARGAGGRLASTIPALTPPAWTSVMTGVDPGRHGIYAFTRPTAEDYTERVIPRTERQVPSVWQYLSAAGRTVGVFNLSVSYPPESVNGFLFAGWDAPVLGPEMAYPTAAYATAMQGLSGYVHYRPDGLRDEVASREVVHQTRQQRDMLFNLTRAYPVEVLAANFNGPDSIHHRGWPLGMPVEQLAASTGSPVEEVYRELDTLLGELLERYADENTQVVLISDHGGGPVTGQVSLAAALEEGGFLVRPSQKRTEGRRGLRLLANRLLPRGVKARIWSLLGGQKRWEMEAQLRALRTGKVDWEHSVAFPWSSSGFIQVNIRGRQPRGCVDPADRDRVLDDVEACLRAVRDPVTGAAPLDKMYRGEAIYKEPRVGYMPDLVVDDTDYVPKPYWENREVVRNLAAQGPGYTGLTGDHRPEGILATCGPAVRAGTPLPPLGMADVAPALLYLAGVPIPDGLDGQLASSVWDTGAAVERQAAQSLDAAATVVTPYSDQEQAAVEERLRDLGYM